MIKFILILTRTGKTRFSKFYTTLSFANKHKIEQDVARVVAQKGMTSSNSPGFAEYQSIYQLVFRRYAGLYFIVGMNQEDPLLPAYEFIQLFVETLDLYFGNVCELDLVFKFDRIYSILDEIVLCGEIANIDKSSIIKFIKATEILG